KRPIPWRPQHGGSHQLTRIGRGDEPHLPARLLAFDILRARHGDDRPPHTGRRQREAHDGNGNDASHCSSSTGVGNPPWTSTESTEMYRLFVTAQSVSVIVLMRKRVHVSFYSPKSNQLLQRGMVRARLANGRREHCKT